MKKIVLFFLSALLVLSSVSVMPSFAAEFSDFSSDAWFAKDVAYVTENGIFNGMGAGTFSPNAPFTRAMFVVTLGRLHGIDPVSYKWKVLGDVEPDTWYGPYVAWAFDNAITQSMGNDDFRPDYNVTREQIATFIARYLKKFEGLMPKTEELSCNFKDADKISAFAVESVGFCAELGLMQGDENGNFRPQDGITRAEAAAVVARLHRFLNTER